MTKKELGYRVNRGIKNIFIEISKDNRIAVERQVLQICENYIRPLLLIQWKRKTEFEPE